MTAILCRLRFRYLKFPICAKNDVKCQKRDGFWTKILELSGPAGGAIVEVQGGKPRDLPWYIE